MEFTFEYKNGEVKLYSGTGKHQEEIDINNQGWNTSPQFAYVAKEIYNTFNESIIRLQKEKGQKNLTGKLTLDLEYS